MTVAEYIADQLFKRRARYVFGVPGGNSITYIDAFKRAGLEFILTANESAAAVMADVTARLTGVPGICLSTLGPGATGLSSGIGEALLDRSPVIALASEVSENMINRTMQMNINNQKLFEPLCKSVFRLSPRNTPSIIERAFNISTAEYPGPVYIGLPSGIEDQEVGSAFFEFPGDRFHEYENDIKGIQNLLACSVRPVLAIGLTFARLGSTTELNEFLEKHKMPVVITPMAKGILNEDHPCYAGVLFHALSDCLEDIFQKADLVIGLGYDPVEVSYESWIPNVPLVHFNTIKTDLPELSHSKQFIGSPDEWFALLDHADLNHLQFNRQLVESTRDEMLSVFNGFSDHFGPVTALKVLQDELPADSILTTDVGSHLHLAGQFWLTGGNKNILMTNGWSGMGFGLPAAIAAKITKPFLQVTCITGDGGFLMTAGEIVTARRYNLPIVVVVFSDGELNLIRLKQTWGNHVPYATKLYSGDLFNSNNFMGIKVITADSEDSMKIAVREALSVNSPVIINARIDPEDYNWLVVRTKN